MVVMLVYPHPKAFPQLLHTGCNKLQDKSNISIQADHYHGCMRNKEEGYIQNPCKWRLQARLVCICICKVCLQSKIILLKYFQNLPQQQNSDDCGVFICKVNGDIAAYLNINCTYTISLQFAACITRGEKVAFEVHTSISFLAVFGY